MVNFLFDWLNFDKEPFFSEVIKNHPGVIMGASAGALMQLFIEELKGKPEGKGEGL